MRQLIKNHYVLTKKRGLITPEPPLSAFIDKMEEEYREVVNCYADDLMAEQSPSGEFIQECTDLVMVVLNMFQHLGIDFEDELKANIKVQESRVKNIDS